MTTMTTQVASAKGALDGRALAAALARAQERDLDALLLSPVFATASHPGAPVLGPVRGAMIAAASRVPVYALGGIGPHNAARLPRAFSGIAAITSLL